MRKPDWCQVLGSHRRWTWHWPYRHFGHFNLWVTLWHFHISRLWYIYILCMIFSLSNMCGFSWRVNFLQHCPFFHLACLYKLLASNFPHWGGFPIYRNLNTNYSSHLCWKYKKQTFKHEKHGNPGTYHGDSDLQLETWRSHQTRHDLEFREFSSFLVKGVVIFYRCLFNRCITKTC